MKPGDEAYEELCQTLRQEASEQLERIGAALLEIERGTRPDRRGVAIEEAFRQAHNLKGAASSLGFTLTARLAHAMESALDDLRYADAGARQALLDSLHHGLTVVPDALATDPEAKSHPEVDPIVEELEQRHREIEERRTGEHRAPEEGSGPDTDQTRLQRPTDELRIPSARSSTPRSWRGDGSAPSTTLRDPGSDEDGLTRMSPLSSLGAGEETLRVSMRKLDALMAQVGELLGARLRTDQRLTELRGLLTQEEDRLERRKALRSMVRDSAPAQLDAWVQRMVDTLYDGTEHQQSLVRELRELVRAFEADALHSTILSGELQEDIRRIQTFPLSSVLSTLPRAVRNMAREVGKDAELVTEGSDVELDKKVLEALRDPLFHLLRNAVDHGMEPPEVRRRAGKTARGTLRIKADHRGNSIVISVEDDGPGIDVEAVRKRAVDRGLVAEAAAKDLPEHRILQFLFTPGFTTRNEVGSLSGRGVGLDVVRSAIEALHGTVNLQTERGRGTTILIALPLTVYVVHALVLRVGTHTMGLPISTVHRILRVTPDEVMEVEGSECIVVDGRPVALLSLASMLGIEPDDEEHERFSVIVVGTSDSRFALAVDEIVGDQTLLAKSFEPPLVRVRNLGGATVLGDGRVVLMLNPVDLLRSASTREAERGWVVPPASTRDVRPKLLLADDSFTTRALERSVFEMAGFEVTAVADGEEALAALDRDPGFDVIVSDVSMPHVTGLQLCERIRGNARYRTLPVVLVTSLGSDDDRNRGLRAGADAYVVKSEFDHEKLVATVNELLGRT